MWTTLCKASERELDTGTSAVIGDRHNPACAVRYNSCRDTLSCRGVVGQAAIRRASTSFAKGRALFQLLNDGPCGFLRIILIHGALFWPPLPDFLAIMMAVACSATKVETQKTQPAQPIPDQILHLCIRSEEHTYELQALMRIS